ALNRVGVAGELVQFFAGVDVPEANSFVVAAGQEASTVGRERHARDGANMPFETAMFFAGGDVPHVNDVIAAGQNVFAVGGEGNVEDIIGAVKSFDGVAGVHVVNADGAVGAA